MWNSSDNLLVSLAVSVRLSAKLDAHTVSCVRIIAAHLHINLLSFFGWPGLPNLAIFELCLYLIT